MLAKFRKYWFIKVGERSEPRKFWKNCVFNHKICANSEIRTFALPKSGGGGYKPTCAPHFWKWGGTWPPPPPAPPFSYAPPSPTSYKTMFLPAPVYIFTFLLTALEGSANTSQQYENTPEAVMYLTRKKKKKWQMIECWDGKRNNENRVEG